MWENKKDIIGCPFIPNINETLMNNIYRKEHTKMSQGLLLRNKHGAVLLSDSALTGFSDSGEPYLISSNCEKIWKGKDYIAAHAGLLPYDEDVKRTLNDISQSFSERLNSVVRNLSFVMQRAKNAHFNYQLLAIKENNSLLECYMCTINSDNAVANCVTSFANTPLVQPIGLYSAFIIDNLNKEMIKDWTLDELLTNGVKILQYIIRLDNERNNGLFVNGSIRAITIDSTGEMKSYIFSKKQELE